MWRVYSFRIRAKYALGQHQYFLFVLEEQPERNLSSFCCFHMIIGLEGNAAAAAGEALDMEEGVLETKGERLGYGF